jgi:hypothetical protein
MAFRLNRAFGLGKFVKLRINKKSIGLQVGGKYLKGTINTKGKVTGSVGGAGTGMYIQKTKNLKQKTRCDAITNSGNRCTRNSSSNSQTCSQHKNSQKVSSSFQSNYEFKNSEDKILIPNSVDNILSNNIFPLTPKSGEIDKVANLFHTTNFKLEKLHTLKEVILFQKNILIYINFIFQDLINCIKLQQISELKKHFKSDTEYLSLIASEVLTRLFNSSLSTAKLISPVKFPAKNKWKLYGNSFPYEYAVLDYIDLDKKISDQDFIKSVESILENYENWNLIHNFNREMWSDDLESELKIFSDPAELLIPNRLTGLFDLSDKALTWCKGFDLETFLRIYIRCFTGDFNEVKNTKSYKLMKYAFQSFNHDIDKLYNSEVEVTKTAKNFGTFHSKAEVY